jgi:hypothetical protein
LVAHHKFRSARFLIAAAASQYSVKELNRPQLEEALALIVHALTTPKLGYMRVLPEIGINPTSRDLATSLDEWFGAQERDPADWVIFYYTGHGVLDKANTVYLLTSDSKTGFLNTTAFGVYQLAGILLDTDASGKKRRVRRVLFIIDSCHSGAASETVFLQTIKSLFNEPTDMLVSVLAATFPNGEAFAGALARAFAEAIDDEAVGGSQQQFLYLESDLMPAIRKRLSGQKPIYPAFTR